MKPMYSQGKLVRFTKACPECTATSPESQLDSKRIPNLAIKVHLWRIVMQPSISSRIQDLQDWPNTNLCSKDMQMWQKTWRTLGVSIRRMWKPRVAARQLFQLVLPPCGDLEAMIGSGHSRFQLALPSSQWV